jgi:hypothetical protein
MNAPKKSFGVLRHALGYAVYKFYLKLSLQYTLATLCTCMALPCKIFDKCRLMLSFLTRIYLAQIPEGIFTVGLLRFEV